MGRSAGGFLLEIYYKKSSVVTHAPRSGNKGGGVGMKQVAEGHFFVSDYPSLDQGFLFLFW